MKAQVQRRRLYVQDSLWVWEAADFFRPNILRVRDLLRSFFSGVMVELKLVLVTAVSSSSIYFSL